MKKHVFLIFFSLNLSLTNAQVPNIFSPGEIVSSSKVNTNFEHLDNQSKFFRNFFHPEPLTEYHEVDVVFTAANSEGKIVITGEANKNLYLKRAPYCPTNTNPVYLYVDEIKLPLGGLVAPFIIPEGKNVIAKAPNGENTCTLYYFKTKKIISPILMYIRDTVSQRYTVPDGKIFILTSTSLGGSLHSTYTGLSENGISLGTKMSGSSWPFPMIFYRGTILTGPVHDPNNSLLINGYLIDE